MSEWRVMVTGSTLTFTATQHYPEECTDVNYSWRRSTGGKTTEISTNSDVTISVSPSINGQLYYLILSTSTTGSCECVVGPTVSRQILVLTGSTATTYIVHIHGTPTTSTCSGTTYTFTAHQTGYTTPYYQFRFGVSPQPIGSNTTNNILSTNSFPQTGSNPVDCVITEGGTNNPTITSPFWIYIYPNNTPGVIIRAEYASGGQCEGENITFLIEDSYYLGPSPTFQWWENPHASPGWVPIGYQTGQIYETTQLSDQDQIKLVVSNIETDPQNCSSSNTCTSNTITVTINPINNPSVSIVTNSAPINNNLLIPYMTHTFKALPINGGTTPIIKWYYGIDNFTYVQNTGLTWTFNPHLNNYPLPCIICKLESSLPCVTNSIVSSTNVLCLNYPASPYYLNNGGGKWTTDWNWTSSGYPEWWHDVKPESFIYDWGYGTFGFLDKFFLILCKSGHVNLLLQYWQYVYLESGKIYTLTFKYRCPHYPDFAWYDLNIRNSNGLHNNWTSNEIIKVPSNTGDCIQAYVEWRSNTNIFNPPNVSNDNLFNIICQYWLQIDEIDMWRGGGVVDVDGNEYLTQIIGTQRWMTDNLRTTRYNDGTLIPLVTGNTEWMNLNTGAYCWYNNDITGSTICIGEWGGNFYTTSGRTYGALYNYFAINTGKLAPYGWHVATKQDWDTLISYLGGSSIAGGKLKEHGVKSNYGDNHWNSPNTGSVDLMDEDAWFWSIPGGYRSASGGPFYNMGDTAYYWTSTSSYVFMLSHSSSNISTTILSNINGLSVLCVQDSEDPH